jgi:hypothetical protein
MPKVSKVPKVEKTNQGHGMMDVEDAQSPRCAETAAV